MREAEPAIATEGEFGEGEATGREGELERRLQSLRQSLRRLERPGIDETSPLSSGWKRLDDALPDGGLLPGSLVEWLTAAPGSGCGILAMAWLREACRRRDGLVVLIDRQGTWYPPALAAWGISLDRLLWIRPADRRDECWAIDQALRSPGVAVVWGEPRRFEPRWGRRFRAAAEAGGTIGFFEAPLEAADRPSWADLQLRVAPRASPGRWEFRVEVVRARGRARGQVLELELDPLDGTVRELRHGNGEERRRFIGAAGAAAIGAGRGAPLAGDLAARLADPAPRRRAARA